MPTLNWIGKDAVEHHHAEVPYRLVHCDGELSAGDPDAGNLLVQGDNLEALKSLLPYYGGQVKCIYIDPPYNTGNEGWVYNDNVASPEIKAWLGKVVGKEADDLSRHDKWLCMMYPRLRLLRDFLRDDGVVFVSSDDTEQPHLRLVLNEIFGTSSFSASLIWQKKYSPQNDASGFSEDHDFITVYSRNSSWAPNPLPRTAAQDKAYKNPDSDERGPWKPSDLTRNEYRERDYYAITTPSGKEVWPAKGRSWSRPPEEIENLRKDNRLYFGRKGDAIPSLKRFRSEVKDSRVPQTFLPYSEVGHNQEAKKEVKDIFPDTIEPFNTPKPTRLITHLLRLAMGENDIAMDSFAGSGTTGQAVLELNKHDGGNRRFILVEMDEKIAPNITAERLRRVIYGYDKGGDPSKPVEGLGGGFRYCQLGVPLFNEFGDIDTAVSFPDLAAHIFFAETGVPIPSKASEASSYLGKHGDKAVYLLFAPGQEGTPREALGNVLTPDAQTALPAPPEGFEGVRVVYAEGTTVSPDRLKAEGVVFKQIPYQIEGA